MFELQLALLALTQQISLPLNLVLLEVQVDEHGDLRSENVGVEGLEHVVDRAHRVALEHVRVFLADRAQENDGDRARLLSGFDDLRYLETVHPGHLDVEEDGGELSRKNVLQRFRARSSSDEALSERLEDRFQS